MKKNLCKFLLLIVLLSFLLSVFSGCSEKRLPGGRLNVAVPDEEIIWAGNRAFETSGTGKTISDLCFGMSPVYLTSDGRYKEDNRTVLSIEETFEADGNKVFTINLRSDLFFSDGTPINADNYISALLLFSSSEFDVYPNKRIQSEAYIGWLEYSHGEPFKGVKKISDTCFSVTVSSEFVPLYHDYRFIDFSPIDLSLWLPEGTRLAVDKDGACNFVFSGSSVDTIQTCSQNAFSASVQNRSTGPYRVSYSDGSSIMLSRNEHYLSFTKNDMPLIDTIVFSRCQNPLDAVLTGGADICLGIDATPEIYQSLSANSNVLFSSYENSIMTEVIFQCDTGATTFPEVRKAIRCLFDLTDTNCYTQPSSLCSTALWFNRDPINLPSKGISEAQALLEDSGWKPSLRPPDNTESVFWKTVSPAIAGTTANARQMADNHWVIPLKVSVLISEEMKLPFELETIVSKAKIIGMDLEVTVCPEEEFYSRLTRNYSYELDYSIPQYEVFITNLPVNYSSDFSGRFSTDINGIYSADNISRISDETLYSLSLRLSHYNTIDTEYKRLWDDFSARWQDLCPDAPLLRCIKLDVYSQHFKGYIPTDNNGFSSAVLSSWIDNR